MNRSGSCIATEAALLLAGLLFAAAASAAPAAGMVTQLSGPLLVQKGDGRAKVAATGSAVEAGDTLLTGHDAYAGVRMADGSSMILQPDTELRVDAFSFDAGRKQDDAARLTLAKGGLQMTTGAIVERSASRYALVTLFGTMQLTPSKFVVAYGASAPAAVAANERIHLAMNSAVTLSDASPAMFTVQLALTTPPPGPTLAPGLYVHVIDGLINLLNKGGSLSVQAGQFGYVSTTIKPPVIVPINPGIQFTPPPSFTSNPGPNQTSNSGKSNNVDCEVR